MDTSDCLGRSAARDRCGSCGDDRGRSRTLGEAGAKFETYVDDIGGSTAIATGSTHGPGEEVVFGVLDYGEATSYLLVSGSYEEHGNSVSAALRP